MPGGTDNAAGGQTGGATPDTGIGGGDPYTLNQDEPPHELAQDAAAREEVAPQDVLDELSAIEQEVSDAETEILASHEETLRAVDGEMERALQGMNLALAELGGSIELELDRAFGPIFQQIDKGLSSLDDELGQIAAILYQVTPQMPLDVDTMSALNVTPPGEWLPYLIPEIAAALGGADASGPPAMGSPGVPPQPPGGWHGGPVVRAAQEKCDAADPSCAFGSGTGSGIGSGPAEGSSPLPPPPPPEPPPPDDGTSLFCNNQPGTFWLPSGGPGGGGRCVPADETGTGGGSGIGQGEPVPPPPAPPTPGGECCVSPPTTTVQFTDSCGNPVSISTPAPSITSPGMGGGAPFGPPTGPPPPVNVTVNIPPIPTGPSPTPQRSAASFPRDEYSFWDWSRGNVCAAIEGAEQKAQDDIKKGAAGGDPWHQFLSWVLDLTPDMPGDVSAAFKSSEGISNQIQTSGIHAPISAIRYAGLLTACNFAEKYTGAPLSYMYQSVQYAYQSLNTQFIPEQPGIDALYNCGYIDDPTWECLTRAHGNIPGWRRGIREIEEKKPNEHDVTQLFFRGYLTEAGYYSRMGELGWRRTEYADDMRKLFEQYPGQPDQLRYLVRDSWDKDVVRKYQYDKDWELKFTDDARKLALATGISERWFRMYWWAHWIIPSYTQLTEILHRFRVDRPERMAWEKENPRGGSEDDWEYYHRGPLAITLDMIREALEVNDMAPAWVDAMIGIAYRPITNSDAIRAFAIGTFNQDELYHAFRDNGYDERNATTLVGFYRDAADKQQANATGVLTARQVIGYYKDGSITHDQAIGDLKPSTPDMDRRRELLDNADRQLAYDQTRAVTRLIKKSFMYGKMDTGQAADELRAAGVAGVQADQLAGRWDQQRQWRSKEATVKQLCQWYNHKLLTAGDYYKRLRNLGYDEDDVFRIAGVCDQDWQADELKKQIAAEKAAAAAAEKALKAREKILKEMIAAQEKQLKELQQKIKDAQKQLDKLQKSSSAGGSGGGAKPPTTNGSTRG